MPEKVTREEYNAVREDYNAAGGKFPQWYIGAVGFLASYNGRFFDGGYAGYGKDKGRIRDYYQESRNNILQQMQQGGVFGIDFRSGDYREYAPEGCVIYCDPPYLLSTRCRKQYKDEMTDADHVELLETLLKHKGPVIISGYASEMYDDILKGWSREEYSNYAQNAKPRKEIIWYNTAPQPRQLTLF